MKGIKKDAGLAVILILVLLSVFCASSNRLNEYEFQGRRAGISMAIPPPPEVF